MSLRPCEKTKQSVIRWMSDAVADTPKPQKDHRLFSDMSPLHLCSLQLCCSEMHHVAGLL